MKNIFKIVIKMDEQKVHNIKSNNLKDAKRQMDAWWEKLK